MTFGQDGERPTTALQTSFVDGRPLITLAQPKDAGPLLLRALELEPPAGFQLPDLGSDASAYRHHRCKLRSADLTCTAKIAECWLRRRLDARDSGYRHAQLTFAEGHFEIRGYVSVGPGGSDFVFRGILLPEGERLRIGLSELLLFGAIPIPAPIIAGSLLAAIAGSATTDDEVQLIGCTDMLVDPLYLALLGTLPAEGWRLPQRGARLTGVSVARDGVQLSYYQGDRRGVTARRPTVPSPYLEVEEAKDRCRAIEQLLLDGHLEQATAAYRHAHEERPRDRFVLERLLQLLVVDSQNDQQVLNLCEQAQHEFGWFPPALLAEANVLVRRNRQAEAAERYIQVAEGAAERARSGEQCLARVAAAQLLVARDRDAAVVEIKRALEVQPDDRAAMSLAAKLYAETESWHDLVELRRRQLALADDDSQRVQANLALGELYRAHLKDAERARDHYELALKDDPSCEPALQGLAQACIDAGFPVRAVSALERVLDLARSGTGGPELEVALHVRIATLWQHLGDHQKALSQLERAEQTAGGSLEILLRIAEIHSALEQPAQAAATLERLLARQDIPRDQRVATHRQLAQLYLEALCDIERASQVLEDGLKHAPNDADSLRLLVRIAEESGDPDAIASALSREAASTGDPAQRATKLLKRGRLLAATGGHRIADAVAALSEAVRDAPEQNWEVHRELALLHEQQQDYTAARVAWRVALADERGDTDGDGWHHLGLIEERLGMHDDARESLRNAARMTSGSVQITSLVHLSNVCKAMQDPVGEVRALQQLEVILSEALDGEVGDIDKKKLARYMQRLAATRAADRDSDAAIRALTVATQLDPHDTSLLDDLARIYEARGQWNEARTMLSLLADELGPEHRNERSATALRIASSLTSQGHLGDAVNYYHQALDDETNADARHAIWRSIIDLHLRRGDPVAAARANEDAANDTADIRQRAKALTDAANIWLERTLRRTDAIRCLRAALDYDTRNEIALDTLERLWTEQHNHDGLADVLQRKLQSVEVPAKRKPLLMRLGQLLLDLERHDEARRTLNAALEIDPDYVPALLAIARHEHSRNNLDRAADHLARLLRVLDGDPHDIAEEELSQLMVEVHLKLANIAAGRGRARDEELHLLAARKAAPADSMTFERLERLFRRQRRMTDLIDLLAERAAVCESLEERYELTLRRARMLADAGDVEGAHQAYAALESGDAQSYAVLKEIAALLRGAQRWDELLPTLEQTLHHPDTSSEERVAIRAEAGRVAIRLGQHERAREHLEAALRRDPHAPVVLDGLLELLADDDDRQDELDRLIERRVECETDADARVRLRLRQAELFLRRSEPEKAAERLQRAIDAGDRVPGLLRLAGHVNERIENWQGAAMAYDLLRQRASATEDEAFAIRQLLRLIDGPLSNHQHTVALCQRMLELDPSNQQAHQLLADAYGRQEAWTEQATVLTGLLDLLRASYGSLTDQCTTAVKLAQALSRAGDEDQAAIVLVTLTNAEGLDVESLQALASTAKQIGSAEAELAALSQLAKHDRQSTLIHLRLAELLIENGTTANACAALATVVEQSPIGPTRSAAARQLLALSDSDHDRRRALIALDQDDASDEERRALALAYRANKEPSRALEVLERTNDDNAAADLRLELLREVGDFSTLSEELERNARGQQDPDARAERLLAAAENWLKQTGDLSRARECARDATVTSPTPQHTAERVCELFADHGELGALIKLLQGLAAEEAEFGAPLRALFLCQCAHYQRLAGHPPSSVEQTYRVALELDPMSPYALDALIALERERGDEATLAEVLTHRAALGGPDHADIEALLEAAQLYGRRLNNPQRAVELLEQARIASDDPRLLPLLAEFNLQLGDLVRTEQALVAMAESGIQRHGALQRARKLARLRGDSAAEQRYAAMLSAETPTVGVADHQEAQTGTSLTLEETSEDSLIIDVEEPVPVSSSSRSTRSTSPLTPLQTNTESIADAKPALGNFSAAEATVHHEDEEPTLSRVLAEATPEAPAWSEHQHDGHESELTNPRFAHGDEDPTNSREISSESAPAEQAAGNVRLRRPNATYAGSLDGRWHDDTANITTSSRDQNPTPETPTLSQLRDQSAHPSADGDHVSRRRLRTLHQRAATATIATERVNLLLEAARITEQLQGPASEALDVYQRAVDSAPNNKSALEALADAAYRHQDWHRAREIYNRLAELGGGNETVTIAYRRGVIYEALGATSTADRCYQQALSTDPTHRLALEARARLAVYRDDIDTELAVVKTLASVTLLDEPLELADLRERLGELYTRNGNLREAERYLKGALALDPDRPRALQLLLNLYEQMSDQQSAVDTLQQLSFRIPDPDQRADMLYRRAEILAKHLQREAEAIDCLLRAYDIAPNHVPTLWRLVDYYWAEGDHASVAEIGAELADQGALDRTPPDHRHLRIALSALIGGRGVARATELAEQVLADPAFAPLIVTDMATLALRELLGDPLVQLLDKAGAREQTAQSARALLEQPSCGKEQRIAVERLLERLG